MIAGKKVLITGASSGIGRATAKLLAGNGCHLFLVGRRAEKLDVVKKECADAGALSVQTFVLDVSDRSAVESWFAGLPAQSKQIDILINNAGLSVGTEETAEGNLSDWDAMIDTNLKGLLIFTRLFLTNMKKRNEGHIVHMGSIAGHVPYATGTVYCATKAAVKSITESMRLELYKTRIRVTSVDPGMVKTEFTTVRLRGDQKKSDELYKDFSVLTPEDVADAILFCVTRPAHVTVQDIVLMPTHQGIPGLFFRDQE